VRRVTSLAILARLGPRLFLLASPQERRAPTPPPRLGLARSPFSCTRAARRRQWRPRLSEAIGEKAGTGTLPIDLPRVSNGAASLALPYALFCGCPTRPGALRTVDLDLGPGAGRMPLVRAAPLIISDFAHPVLGMRIPQGLGRGFSRHDLATPSRATEACQHATSGDPPAAAR
jgi:hypothetical protein